MQRALCQVQSLDIDLILSQDVFMHAKEVEMGCRDSNIRFYDTMLSLCKDMYEDAQTNLYSQSKIRHAC